MPRKYRAKPVDVEAIQITEENFDEVLEWCDGCTINDTIFGKCVLFYSGLGEDSEFAPIGFYMVRFDDGRLRAMMADAFAAEFEERSNAVDEGEECTTE